MKRLSLILLICAFFAIYSFPTYRSNAIDHQSKSFKGSDHERKTSLSSSQSAKRSHLDLMKSPFWQQLSDDEPASPNRAAGNATAQNLEYSTHAPPPVQPAEYNGDVRDLPQVPSKPKIEIELQEPPSKKNAPLLPESLDAPNNISVASMPNATQNFAGMSAFDTCVGGSCGAGSPPDINGDVGLNHYIEAVNSSWAIYSKGGTLLASFTENSLWSGVSSGTPCDSNNQGDPVVVYDQFADRWILSNFAFTQDLNNQPVKPFYQCFAVSKSSDPVSGGWWLYAVKTDTGAAAQPPDNTFNDYPKFGNWNDGCLYMSANEYNESTRTFAGTLFASFNKSDMESGAPLTFGMGFVNNASDPFTMIPSNISGATSGASLPNSGTPNYFVSESETSFSYEVRKFTPGTTPKQCGGGGTLSAATNVSQGVYGAIGEDIVPQPAPATSSNNLDSLRDRLMQRVQYRRVGSTGSQLPGGESLWVVHSVQTSPTSTVRPQWAQIDVTGGAIGTTPLQEQIYAPDTSLYRWMGSIAADHDGNAALGYSTSNDTSPNFPSIAYSGRLSTDPLNNLSQGETQLIAGAGSQTNNCGGAPCVRWGDYTSMSVDPSDDCTFWYANEYYSNQTNGNSGNWQTRVGSFKFPGCGGGAVAPSPPTTNAATNVTSSGFTANWNSSSGATGYRLDVSTSSAFSSFVSGFQDLDVGNVLTRSVTGLNAGTTYFYRLRAYNGGGTSGNSATISLATTVNPPLAPTANAASSVTSTGFTANWSSATGAAGYRLDVSTVSTFSSFVSGFQDLDVGNVLSRSVSGLSASTTYFYRVRAYNAGGTSGNSGTISVTTTAGAPPVPIANAGTSVTNTSFTANWSSSSGATGYRLDVSPVNTFSSFVSGFQDLNVGNVLSRSVTGLSSGTTYFYRVRAFNGGGTSTNSGTISVTTTSPTIQVTVQTNPVGRSFTVDGTTFTTTQTLSWTTGSSHTVGTSSPQSGTTGTQFVWNTWSDGGLISHSVAPTTATTYTANFTTQFRLIMNAGTGGTVSPATAFFNSGQSVNISATPNSGFTFTNWTGTGTGSFGGAINPASVTMNGPITETASFASAPRTIQLSAPTYTAAEGNQFGTITITVTRTGDTSSSSSVNFATSDGAGTQNCNVINGRASSRCDYISALGTVSFAVGETVKAITILIINDSYAEGNESLTISLSNPVGATLGSQSTATVTITDNETTNGANPFTNANFFVTQHYADFLNRTPDPGGLAFWTNEITSCGSNQACIDDKRVNVSAAYFLSIEFQQTGYLVERMYKGAYGDITGNSTFGSSHTLPVPIVRLNEFLPDTQTIGKGVVVGQTGWEQVLENNKVAFILEFVQRSRFTSAYPTSMTPTLFVDTLFAHAGVSPSATDRSAAISEFGVALNTADVAARARALRRVAENSTLSTNEFNRAFVLMQFFGYLRRNPNDPQDADYTGYDFWLTKLNSFTVPGDDPLVRAQKADMVKAFITSTEYRQRFGP